MALRNVLPRIEAPDRRRFICAAGAFVCVTVASLLARIAGDSLFLGTYGRESLAVVYLGTALVVSTLSMLYGVLSGRFNTLKLISGSGLLLFACVVLVRFGLELPARPVRIGAYLLADLTVSGSMILFWTYFSQLYDSRKAKQYIGLIGAFGTLACMVAAAGAGRFNAAFGVENLFIPVAFLIACFTLIVRLGGSPDSAAGGSAFQPGTLPLRTRLRAQFGLLRNDHVRGLAVMVVVAVTTTTIIDFQFKAGAQAFLATSELPGFFGRFYAVTNVVILAVQLFLVSWVLRKGGLLVSLGLLPALVMLTSLGIVGSGSFDWIVASRFVVQVLILTLDGAGLHVLFLGVRRQSYSQARSLVDGICKPLAMGLSGALLFATSLVVDSRGLAVAALVLALFWMVLARRNYRSYLTTLVESLSAKLLYPHERPEGSSDRALELQIRERIREAPPEDLPYLLAILRDAGGSEMSSEVLTLLERSEPQAKIAALEQIRDGRGHVDAEVILGLCRHPEAAVRRAALEAAAGIEGSSAEEALVEALRDPQAEVRAEAALGLSGRQEPSLAALGRSALEELLNSTDPGERSSVAAPLGVPGRAEGRGLINRLLEDSNPEVVQSALQACRTAPDDAVLPLVLPQLGDPAMTELAVNALEALGESSIQALNRLPEGKGQQLLAELPALSLAVARIGGPEALQLARESIRSFALTPALADCYGRLILKQSDRTQFRREITELLADEVEALKKHRALMLSLPVSEGTTYLRLALAAELEVCRQKVFLLLEILVPGVDMQVLRYRVESSRPEERSQALEVIENLVPSQFRRELPELLDSASKGVPLSEDPVRRILTSDGFAPPVLAGALYAAGEARRRDLVREVERCLDHPVEFCREAAGKAFRRLDSALERTVESAETTGDSKRPGSTSPVPDRIVHGDLSPMIAVERVLFLKNVPLFARMNATELASLAQITQEVVYPAGARVLTEGEMGDSMFLVVDGEVEIHRGDTELGILRSKDHFGEMAILDGEPRSASATARTDCLLLAIRRRDFNDLLTRHNSIARAVIGTLCERLRSTLAMLPAPGARS